MKDQYVADIGDYGKYSLLRAFAEAGVKVGINWYYTGGNDGTNAGKFKDYLEKEKEDQFSHYCPDVYRALKDIPEEERTIKTIRKKSIVPGACYHDDEMTFEGTPDERKDQREEWFENSLTKLDPAELIYLDPDNGLLTNEKVQRRKIAVKYALPDEIEKYYTNKKCYTTGKNIVYYCHKGRRKDSAWDEYKAYMLKRLPDAKQIVLTYHKGTQRSYVFLIHPEDFNLYKQIIDQFVSNWPEAFEKEQIIE